MKYTATILLLIALTGCGGVTSSDSSAPSVSTANQHAVTLRWNASTTPSVTYNIYRGTQTLGPYSQIARQIASLSYEDADVSQGVLYFYVVTAADSLNQESAFSNEATALIP
jgi:fibronectin type 3 domain-containing protein